MNEIHADELPHMDQLQVDELTELVTQDILPYRGRRRLSTALFRQDVNLMHELPGVEKKCIAVFTSGGDASGTLSLLRRKCHVLSSFIEKGALGEVI